MTAPERFKAVEQLAMQGLLEWTVVDPGSVNLAHYDRLAAGQEGFVYLNPEGHVRYGLELAARYRFHPSYAIYEPGFLRLGAALARVYPGRADADLPLHVLGRLRVRLSAPGLRARCVSGAARGRERRARPG